MVDEVTQVPDSTEDLNVGSEVRGVVKHLAVYGAMVDVGLEQNALLHISQVGRSDFRDIGEVYNVGDEVTAYVLKIDNEDRIALTLEKPPALPWSQIHKDNVYKGTVIRIENYGAFVDIGAERPGMVHVSELADGYVQSPEDVVSVGDEVEVRVIKLNRGKRQIDLSMKTPEEDLASAFEPAEDVPSAMELAFRRAEKQSRRDRSKGNKKNKRYRDDQDDIIRRTLGDQYD
jgi:ribosomal protein S1